jgi:hypothetical protein
MMSAGCGLEVTLAGDDGLSRFMLDDGVYMGGIISGVWLGLRIATIPSICDLVVL